MRIFRSCLKQAILSKGFLCGVLIAVTAGIIGSQEALSYMNTFKYYFAEGDTAIFLNILNSIKYAQIYLLSIPLVSAFSYGSELHEEIKSRFFLFRLIRCRKSEYIYSQIFTIAVSGGLMIAMSWTLLVLYSGLMAREIQAFSVHILFECAGRIAKGMIFGLLSGSLWAAVGGLSAITLESRHGAYIAPFIIYYFLYTFQKRYYKEFYYFNPAEWMSPQYFQEWKAILILIGLIVMTIMLYILTAQRRMRDI